VQENSSEIAAFRQTQALQEQAAHQGLYGLAVVASHEAIEKRMEQGAEYLIQQMAQLLSQGKHEQARALAINDDVWDRIWTQLEQ
jgi:hypothetical protein